MKLLINNLCVFIYLLNYWEPGWLGHLLLALLLPWMESALVTSGCKLVTCRLVLLVTTWWWCNCWCSCGWCYLLVCGWWYLLGWLSADAGCTRTNLCELFACTVALKRALVSWLLLRWWLKRCNTMLVDARWGSGSLLRRLFDCFFVGGWSVATRCLSSKVRERGLLITFVTGGYWEPRKVYSTTFIGDLFSG